MGEIPALSYVTEMDFTPAPAFPLVHHEAPLMASCPPAPGHLLEAGRQPASVTFPSEPMKLYLEHTLDSELKGCREVVLLLVDENDTRSRVGKPSL